MEHEAGLLPDGPFSVGNVWASPLRSNVLPVSAMFCPLCKTVPGKRDAATVPDARFEALVASRVTVEGQPSFTRAVAALARSDRLLLGCNAAERVAAAPNPRLFRAVAAFGISERLFAAARKKGIDWVAAVPKPRFALAVPALARSDRLFAASRPFPVEPLCSVQVFAAVQRYTLDPGEASEAKYISPTPHVAGLLAFTPTFNGVV